MKKSLFFAAAASALLLTACSSENDLIETGPQKTVENQAVGFDVYTPSATNTRAGRAGVMTTGIMKETGFGVYAYQNDDSDYDYEYDYSVGPNFMWNQQINFNSIASGWYYSPLKYWPNETGTDSQTSPTYPAGMPDQTAKNNIDKLTFFAYAPWVKATPGSGAVEQVNTELEAGAGVGITTISANTTTANDPKIWYTMATNPDYSVDLLWGVAPVGDLTYTNVHGTTTTIKEGFPLIGLIKPAVNTNIKFLFQHALSRFGVKVIAAVDQVAAGGVLDYANTKITIDEIRIIGNFGTEGTLNLNNTAMNKANWTFDAAHTASDDAKSLKITSGKGLAPHLVYDSSKNPASGDKSQQEVTGVTATLADAIKVRSLYDADYEADCVTKETGTAAVVGPPAVAANPLIYSATRPYFAAAADIATPTYAAFNDFSATSTPTTSYLQKYETNQGVTYTDITSTINTEYPNATVWEEIYTIPTADILKVVAGTASTGQISLSDAQALTPIAPATKVTAYRQQGNTYTATGQPVQVGDYVFTEDAAAEIAPTTSPVPTYVGDYWKAKPNYFMVIPPADDTAVADRTLKVKITYYVSTTDANVKGGVVYTKNEVEKDVVLPNFKNGKAYDLKLILGLTSVKIEAEVADWVTTNAEVNLPQNTAE